MKKKKLIKRLSLVALVVLLIVWWFSLPKTLFQAPLSTVVWSEDHQLLGARVADDQQWRFPAQDSIPEKFKTCIIYFEDEYFEYHIGFNPISMGKALWQNLTTDSKRGGSTLTQQVIRLSRGNKQRTYSEKLIELFFSRFMFAEKERASPYRMVVDLVQFLRTPSSRAFISFKVF